MQLDLFHTIKTLERMKIYKKMAENRVDNDDYRKGCLKLLQKLRDKIK